MLYLYTLIILFIFYIGYFGIRHQDMFTHNVEVVKNAPSLQEKYKKSGLREEAFQTGHSKLLNFMTAEKPYLDPKLTLSGLANELEMSANQLSQIINQQEAVNFQYFVNRFRVNEFIERASKNDSFSFLAHALDSGFNSKSSFNSIFKKHKGMMTPSQFLKYGEDGME